MGGWRALKMAPGLGNHLLPAMSRLVAGAVLVFPLKSAKKNKDNLEEVAQSIAKTNAEFEAAAKKYLKRIIAAGLQYRRYKTTQEDALIVEIRAPLKRLEHFAGTCLMGRWLLLRIDPLAHSRSAS